MTKVISLSNSAYDELKALKVADESFSDVVHKLVKGRKKRPIMEFAGIWKGAEFDEVVKTIQAERKRFKLREVKI